MTRAGAVRPLRFVAVWTLDDGNAIVTTLTKLADNFEAQRDDVLPYLLTLQPT
jgi:hypothetical protein